MTPGDPPVVLVSGGSSGIGRAVATLLVQRGWRVGVTSRSPERRDETVRMLQQAAPAGVPIRGDLLEITDPDSVSRVLEGILQRWGRLDAVAAVAGTFDLAKVEDTSPAMFRRQIEVNLIGTFYLLSAALTIMRRQRNGHLLAVGSIAAKRAFPYNAAYAASKFGLRGLVEVLATECTGSGVTVSIVHPPAVDTPLWDALSPERLADFDRTSFLRPREVAERIVGALESPAASFNDIDLF